MARRDTVEVSFYIECEECGYDLEARYQAETITVTPCKRCMADKYNDGVKDGAGEAGGQG